MVAPAFPIPQPAKPVGLQPRAHPLFDKEYKNDAFKPPSIKPPSKVNKVKVMGYDDPALQIKQQPAYYRPEIGASGLNLKPAANPIPIPTNDNATGGEDFGKYATVDDAFEPSRTPAQVEDDLKELVTHAMEEVQETIDEEERFVEGFEEGYELLDHQVLARRWMRERESAKKTGGILADDMG